MTKQDYLRMAAARIDSGQRYSWCDTTACNCGIIAQCVLGVDERELEFRLYNSNHMLLGLWSVIPPTCPKTGIPLHNVLAALHNAGFSQQDLKSAEHLDDESVCLRAGIDYENHAWFRSTASCVVRYFRAWADLLDESPDTLASASASDIVISAHPVSALVCERT